VGVADAFAADLVGRLTAAFEAQRNPAYATAMAAYMRNQFPFIGIPTPQRRALSREVLTGIPRPTERQLAAVMRAVWALPEREYQYFGCDYSNGEVRVASPRYLVELRRRITTKSWWDTVDALVHSVATLLRASPELVTTMDEWIDDDNVWVARVAILHQLGAKNATDTERLFDYCTRRADHPDFFVRKAIGWALREYSKTDPDAVLTYVNTMDGRLSPLSRREALKRIASA
jgi:3-methyladenine DNA glycosylase AlkD